MKKHFLVALAVVGCLAAKAQSNNDKEPYLTKALTNDVQKVKVETSGGSIAVEGASSSPKIEMYVNGNNSLFNKLSKDEIKKRLEDDYIVNINFSNNVLTATAKPKERNMDWKKSLSISFKVYVPKNVSTDLATSGGSIKLANLSGTQNFATSGGSLNVEGISGKIDGKTSGGSIKLSNSQDDIDLSTSGGSIDASNCKGNIRLSTSGGSLKLNDLNGKIDASTSGGSVNGSKITGELSAHTSGGSVRLSEMACSLSTSTSGGSMDVEITQLGKFVKISNSGGNIKLDLPKGKGLDLSLHGRKVKVNSLSNFSGNTDEDNISGKINGGGVPVDVKAGSGTLTVNL
ncbi:hypothetical protein QTN47_00540 [Danxiaibacter flavus]|uniref:Adhesin domain-containing protein n=1 Tax=Danxiaibacter flavus TaxID=3049108 RepID=A0ABV3Z7X9_9BACT|nr:hypothetical protein QNM32_00540 [Chitinophagaceae bacterium DXS]